MTELFSAQHWLAGDPARRVSVAPERTLADLTRDVKAAAARLQPLQASRIAIETSDPYPFVVALLAVLHTQRTPILFADHEVGFDKFAGEYDAVLSLNPMRRFPKPVVVFGAKAEPVAPLASLAPIDEAARLLLFTSGSTGVPKRIEKTIAMMDAEARITASLFAPYMKGTVNASSVDPHHMYGLTFAVWLPMSLGIAMLSDRIRFPEGLLNHKERLSFVSTPTFMRHLDLTLPAAPVVFVISAGGRLLPTDMYQMYNWTGARVHEIYGSTETGAIASRGHAGGVMQEVWQLIDEASLTPEGDGWRLASPLVTGGSMLLDDKIAPQTPDARRFTLLGRRDRIAKVGEVRLSLTEVEKVLARELGFQAKALVVSRAHRDAIGVVVNQAESARFERTKVRAYREQLKTHLEPLAIPRYWRCVPEWPYNSQGKIEIPRLQRMFDNDVR